MKTRILFVFVLIAVILAACASPQRASVTSPDAGFSDEAVFGESPAMEPAPFAEEDFQPFAFQPTLEKIDLRGLTRAVQSFHGNQAPREFQFSKCLCHTAHL